MEEKTSEDYGKALAGALLEIRRSISLNIDELAQDKGEAYSQGLVGGYRSCLEYVDQNLRTLGIKPTGNEQDVSNAENLFAALDYGIWYKKEDGNLEQVDASKCCLKVDQLKRLVLVAVTADGKTLTFQPAKYGSIWALSNLELK